VPSRCSWLATPRGRRIGVGEPMGMHDAWVIILLIFGSPKVHIINLKFSQKYLKIRLL
jgi:hypothetical protein